jgi:hypothetical protein
MRVGLRFFHRKCHALPEEKYLIPETGRFPVFLSQEIHREAAAELLLFQEAVRHDTATVAMVEELSTYLKAARGNPGVRFRGEQD